MNPCLHVLQGPVDCTKFDLNPPNGFANATHDEVNGPAFQPLDNERCVACHRQNTAFIEQEPNVLQEMLNERTNVCIVQVLSVNLTDEIHSFCCSIAHHTCQNEAFSSDLIQKSSGCLASVVGALEEKFLRECQET